MEAITPTQIDGHSLLGGNIPTPFGGGFPILGGNPEGVAPTVPYNIPQVESTEHFTLPPVQDNPMWQRRMIKQRARHNRIDAISRSQQTLTLDVSAIKNRLTNLLKRLESLAPKKAKDQIESPFLYRGDLESRKAALKVRRWIIRRSKFNWKYHRGKLNKNKPGRLKDADLTALLHFAEILGITVGYNKETNDLWFERDVEGEDMEIDGLDTGGQAIRMMLTLAMLSGEGPGGETKRMVLDVFSDEDRKLGKKGKACMLYIQARMWSLEVGQSFTVENGDPMNSDAPTFDNYVSLFILFKELFGVYFSIIWRDGGHTIKREKYPIPLFRGKGWSIDNSTSGEALTIDLDTHLVDQVLMGAIALRAKGKDFRQIVIKTKIGRDYHPGAMISIARAMGMEIEDSKPGKPEEIKAWLSQPSEMMRTIVIH